jgi:hypothetical protein
MRRITRKLPGQVRLFESLESRILLNGISGSTFMAAGSIGPIICTGSIVNCVFQGASIGAVTVTAGSITGSTFVASNPTGAGIGAISVTTASGTAIDSSSFTSASDMGDVTVAGDVAASRFVAGYDDATATVTAGKHLGNVSVTGSFIASDLIASVAKGGATWGGGSAGGDTGNTGTIGTVNIGVGPLIAGNPGGLTHGILAGSIGLVTIPAAAVPFIPILAAPFHIHNGVAANNVLLEVLP